MKIRASLGTLSLLGIRTVRMDSPISTGYFLLGQGCSGSCRFCSQSTLSDRKKDRLSRIIWPSVSLSELRECSVEMTEFERVCFQCLQYPEMNKELFDTISFFRGEIGYTGSISASLTPIPRNDMISLRSIGLDNISIPLDVPTGELYLSIKGREADDCTERTLIRTDEGVGRTAFASILDSLEGSVTIFGKGRVTTHLIVGLGETDKELVERMDWLSRRYIRIGLFAFTPLPGTPFEDRVPPDIGRYRAIQLAQYLISEKNIENDAFVFGPEGELCGFSRDTLDGDVLMEIGSEGSFFSGDCFRTAGCEGCNRPYYNERPGQVPYNYPAALTSSEIALAGKDLFRYMGEGNDLHNIRATDHVWTR